MEAKVNGLIEHKWVRLMPDFCCAPLWIKGGGMAEVKDLPVETGLQDRINRWQEWFEMADGFEMRMHQREAIVEDPKAPASRAIVETLNMRRQKFANEGLDIAKLIKQALPDWTIIYFDIAKHESISEQTVRPRHVFEFEVFL